MLHFVVIADTGADPELTLFLLDWYVANMSVSFMRYIARCGLTVRNVRSRWT